MQVKNKWRQVNVFEKGTYRIVEKVQETSSDTGMHTVNEAENTLTAGNNLIPLSIPLQCSRVGYVNLYILIHVFSNFTYFGQTKFS